MRMALLILTLCLMSAPAWALTDEQIQRQEIFKSIKAYPGSCPCPYSVDRAGHQCGRRSAYVKPGGYSPFCYPKDITPEMIKAIRTATPEANQGDQK